VVLCLRVPSPFRAASPRPRDSAHTRPSNQACSRPRDFRTGLALHLQKEFATAGP
jgi:hypothetical protein